MKYGTVEYYVLFDKKFLFLVVLVKKIIYHITKGACEEIVLSVAG